MMFSKKNIGFKKKLISLAVITLVFISAIVFIFSAKNPRSAINYSKNIDELSKAERESYDVTLQEKRNDIFIGDAEAKVTIVAYDSFSCAHCAKFYYLIFPKLKSEYIDTGKIKFIHRDFPLNPSALYASKLVKCYSKNNSISKTFEVILSIYEAQKEWLEASEYESDINNIFALSGLSREEVKKCLEDETMENAVINERLEAIKSLQIKATPVFFINKKELKGEYSFKNFSNEIEKYLIE